MQRLANAVIALIRANATLAAFAGAAGPYWGIAPEKTALPYIVITQVPGLENQQGFSPKYIARAQLQFAIRTDDLDDTADYTETFAAVFDAITSLTLAGGEKSRKPIRTEEPLYRQEPINQNGQRVYAGIVQYRFMVQRTRGA